MIGLALSGGGTKGSYEVGAYLALKKCHIKFDGFVGTSIGSFNAAMLAAGEDKYLKYFWENINIGKLLGFSDDYIKKLENDKKSNTLMEHLMNNAKDIIHNKGFATDGLYQVLNTLNLEDKIRRNKKDFGLITVKAKSFSPVYKFIQDIPLGKLNDYILASCYLPVFKMQKIIDDNYYLDGGFKDNAPSIMLLNKGYDKVYVVDLRAIGIKKKLSKEEREKLVVIKPSHSLTSILNTNKEDMKYNIKLGYYDTLKIIKKLDGDKYIFNKHSNEFYKFLIRKVNKNVLREMEILFNTKNPKRLVLKALELVMQMNKYEYTKVYSSVGVIQKIKRLKKKRGVYRFINQLKIF